MKEATGIFNNWSCPVCKRFIAQPKNGDIGKCKSCGEELFFSVKQLKEPSIDELSTNFHGERTEQLKEPFLKPEWEKRMERIFPPEKEKVGASIPDGRYHLVKAEEISEGPCVLGLSLGDVLMDYLLKSEEAQIVEKIKKLGMKLEGLDDRYTLVNFTNKPYLFKWLQKFDKNCTLSETIISFAAKGVRKYLEEKEAKKT